jgi:hypothetical protein
MVHGWLVGSPLASGVSVGWWEGVDEMEMEDGGAQKTRKSTSSSFFSLAFLNIQSVEYFGNEKQASPNWLSTSFSFLYFQDLSPIRNCHESLDPNSRVGSDMIDHMCLFWGLFYYLHRINPFWFVRMLNSFSKAASAQ